MDPYEVYDRCLSNKPYTVDFKIYSEKYLQKVITKLAELEEYEKCSDLSKYIRQRFNHQENYYVLVAQKS
jgi:hypothetical protein